MSQWYYGDAMNRRQGPIDTATLAALHRDGRIAPDTLVWRDGMDNWRPWRSVWTEVLSEQERQQAPFPASAAAAGTLADGANPYETVEASASPASPYAPPVSPLVEQDGFQAGGAVVYAGFWKRFAALTIDSFLVSIAYYATIFAAMIVFGIGSVAMGGDTPAKSGIVGLVAVVYLSYPLISALYYVGFESSAKQATLGKMAVGIKVADNGGRRLTRSHALGRWASHLLCYFTFYIGYLMAAFTDRKRGLHDMVADTLVVDRWAFTASPQLQQRALGAVAIVIIVLAVVAMLGIVAALAIPFYQGLSHATGGA